MTKVITFFNLSDNLHAPSRLAFLSCLVPRSV